MLRAEETVGVRRQRRGASSIWVSENSVSNTERSPAKHRRPYSVAEIFADGVVHTAALIAGAAGFALLFALAPVQGGAAEYAALIVYAVCFFLMFGFSFAYNMVPDSAVKRWLRRCDHSGIYLMIAGTYTALMALVQAAMVDGRPGRLRLVRRRSSASPPSCSCRPGSTAARSASISR